MFLRPASRLPRTVSLWSKPAAYATSRQRTVVVALGGNAILREVASSTHFSQGESLTQANQEKNIKLATQAIANVIKKGDWNVVVTHGNGPQVGFLALKQESFGLDVLTAETQGMIGWQLDEALESELPGRAVTNLMTQVEVDGDDPAFKNPTKPVGPFYDQYDEKNAPMVQVGNKWRKVVASPKPINILDIKTIRALVTAGNTVICCGGGGIPVIRKDGKVAGVPAVVDKDRTSGLLAANLACDAFIMLTDADALYKDFGKPTQAKIDQVEVEHIDPAFIASLPAGSIRPKVQSAIDFVKSGNGWAAIGCLDNLQAVLDGKSGTRFVRAETSKITTQASLPDHIQEWTSEELGRWMLHDLRMREQTVLAVLKQYKTGREIAAAEPEHLMQRCGLSAMMASHLVNEAVHLSGINYRQLQTVFATPYPWPYNKRLDPSTTALVIIDMQRDFCEEGGYMSSMGYSLDNARRIIPNIARLLARMRQMGFHIIHTREGHLPNLADCPPVKHWRSLNLSPFGIGVKGPLGRLLVRGEPGWNIIPELQPLPHEVVLDKPGKGTFFATEFELILRTLNIKNLILTGVTTDVCVHTTMREANDRGFECLILEDATAAAETGTHWSAIRSVQLSGGIFGATASTDALVDALDRVADRGPSPQHD